MSNRREKKRKTRNPVQRDRTVTELVEDPDTRQLLFTPREEPAVSTQPLSPAFSLGGGGGGVGPGPGFPAMNPNFPPSFPYSNYVQQPMHPQFGPQQHPPMAYYPEDETMMPTSLAPVPGDNDLEVLENLKRMIKNGQHKFYQPIPQPAALASIYMGPHPSKRSVVLPHPEQGPSIHPPRNRAPSSASGPSPATLSDVPRRPLEDQSTDVQDSRSSKNMNPPVSLPPSPSKAQAPKNVLLSSPLHSIPSLPSMSA